MSGKGASFQTPGEHMKSNDFKYGSTTPDREGGGRNYDDHSAERTESNVIDLNLHLEQEESLTN